MLCLEGSECQARDGQVGSGGMATMLSCLSLRKLPDIC